jgi:hypothetical protein
VRSSRYSEKEKYESDLRGLDKVTEHDRPVVIRTQGRGRNGATDTQRESLAHHDDQGGRAASTGPRKVSFGAGRRALRMENNPGGSTEQGKGQGHLNRTVDST